MSSIFSDPYYGPPDRDLRRLAGGRPLMKLAVRCEACGHQATVSVEARNRDPRLVCRCGSREVTFERLPPY